jgi:hypothetical protein
MLAQWLLQVWETDLPFMSDLAEQLVSKAADNLQVTNTMTASDVLETPDNSWQKRIAAAAEPME